MLSEEDYNSLLETLYLAGIPGMYESIIEGANIPLEECEKLEWKSFLQNKLLKILKNQS